MSEARTAFFTVPGPDGERAGHRLAYREWGDRDNPRVLFCVHGLTRNSLDFAAVGERLSDAWRVIAVDMPGRGQSDWLERSADYGPHTYLPDLAGLFDHLAIGPVDWLGTSMGGILGMLMAGRFPDRVRRLVLNDIGAWIPADGLRRILRYAGKRMEFADRAEAEAALYVTCATFGMRTDATWRAFIDASLVQAPDGPLRLAYDPAIVASMGTEQDVKDADLWPVWEAVHCPTLIVRGAESDILTRETAEAMRGGRAGVALVEIAESGHAPCLLEPDQIDAVERWLRQSPAAPD
jgi:pimeloyl-ACP methyl ester carboxylesterase